MQQSKQTTLTEIKIKEQIKQCYLILFKYGYPGMMNSPITESITQMESNISQYFQPTPKRENLIEWLIYQLSPVYSQQIQSKSNKKKKIIGNLWRLGVMPFSKHTKNLDYQKYLDGLLGYQNAISLIFNLCVLLKQKNQLIKSKQDGKFNGFLQDLIANYDSLINQDYDPYKISFPSNFNTLNDQQFNSQYQTIMTSIQGLKREEQEESFGTEKQNTKDYQNILNEFEQSKDKFKTIYKDLITKIKQVTSKHNRVISSWKRVETVSGRTIKISTTLPKLYKQYKQKIKLQLFAQSNMHTEKNKVQNLIKSLNDTVCI